MVLHLFISALHALIKGEQQQQQFAYLCEEMDHTKWILNIAQTMAVFKCVTGEVWAVINKTKWRLNRETIKPAHLATPIWVGTPPLQLQLHHLCNPSLPGCLADNEANARSHLEIVNKYFQESLPVWKSGNLLSPSTIKLSTDSIPWLLLPSPDQLLAIPLITSRWAISCPLIFSPDGCIKGRPNYGSEGISLLLKGRIKEEFSIDAWSCWNVILTFCQEVLVVLLKAQAFDDFHKERFILIQEVLNLDGPIYWGSGRGPRPESNLGPFLVSTFQHCHSVNKG